MKKIIVGILLILIAVISILFINLDDVDKRKILHDVLGIRRPFTWFYVGDMKQNEDRLIYNKEITIWGYLVKNKSTYMLIENEEFAKIHFLKQPNLVFLTDKNNNTSNKEIDDHCVGHFVEAHGKLINSSKHQVIYTLRLSIMFGMEKDFSFACIPTYTNGKLDKQNWKD